MNRFWMMAAMLAVSSGCAHKPPPVPEPAAPPTASAPVKAQPAQTLRSCTTDADCHHSQICVRGGCWDVTRGLAECGHVRLHFPFNSALLETPERTALERSARCLKANRSLRVTIAGHADERGTVEYNLVLGQQRAASVARYLESLGVSQAQLGTVSFGEERPRCAERDEACWSKNRRATVPPPDIAQR